MPLQLPEQESRLTHKPRKSDYSKRAQWLRAAVLGANDGLVSTASLMIGIGAVKRDIKAMILTGFSGLVAGACSMAIGELVSVYSQLDTELSQINRNRARASCDSPEVTETVGEERLPNPFHAAAASGIAFLAGAVVPLLAASFVSKYEYRIWVIVAAVSLALVLFGWLAAAFGKAPVLSSAARVLIGGWVAMAVTFALTKLVATSAS